MESTQGLELIQLKHNKQAMNTLPELENVLALPLLNPVDMNDGDLMEPTQEVYLHMREKIHPTRKNVIVAPKTVIVADQEASRQNIKNIHLAIVLAPDHDHIPVRRPRETRKGSHCHLIHLRQRDLIGKSLVRVEVAIIQHHQEIEVPQVLEVVLNPIEHQVLIGQVNLLK